MPLTTGDQFVEYVTAAQASIVAIITAVLTPEGETEPAALVFPRYAMDKDQDEWAGLLRPEEANAPVHAWMVAFGGYGEGANTTTGARDVEIPFTFDGFWSYRFGKDGENSEQLVRFEVLKVAWALQCAPTLNASPKVKGHKNMQVQVKIGGLGSEAMHKAFGRFTVMFQPLRVR